MARLAGPLKRALALPSPARGEGKQRPFFNGLLAGISFAFSFSFFLAACGSGSKPASEIVVYSPHGIELENDVKAAFEAAHPGLTVRCLDLAGGAILSRVRAERERPACDIWWGGAPSDFRRAEADGLLEPYAPEWTQALPPGARSATGGWAATYLTPEVIFFNPAKVKKEDVPLTWDGLLDPRWKGRLAVRDVRPSATMKTIFSALLWREWKRTGREEDGFAFLAKLHANTGAYAASPEALYSLLLGNTACALAPWNIADALLQKEVKKLPLDFVVPSGTPVPVEPIALLKGGPNPAGARLFYDFVTSAPELLRHARAFHRIPARTDLPAAEVPEWIRALNVVPLAVDWEELEKHQEEWIARWQSEIRARPVGE